VPLLLTLALPLALIITALALALTAAPPRGEALSAIPAGHQGLSSEKEAQLIAAPGEEARLMPAAPENDQAWHTARQALLALPLRFVPNAGQTDPSVRFTVQGAGHTFFLTPQEIVFTAAASQPRPDQARPQRPANPQRRTGGEADLERPFDLVRLRFLGANPNPHLEGLEPLPGVVNYFLGNDPARWRSNVPTYAAVVYQGLYPGIDLVYRGTEGSLKSELRLAPGADPDAIVMAYTGLRSLTLRADGALILETPLGQLTEEAPLIYQQVDGYRREVRGGYTILPSLPVGGGGRPDDVQRVGFRVSGYDPGVPLLIDPVLVFSTYLGGTGYDYGYGIAVDDAGNVYVTGETDSSDFPTDKAIQPTYGGGDRDAFVTQIAKAGGVYTYGYSTYLGGTGDDWARAVAVDGDGKVHLTGHTNSDDFPTHNAIKPTYGGGWEGDAFVTQIISANGVYTYGYSTYLGGSEGDFGYDIAVDGDDNAYVTGETDSWGFPTVNAIQPSYGGDGDAFVTQIISASGVYTYGYSTFLGGGGGDYGRGIAVDGDGNAYVTGETSSPDFPTHNAIQPSLNNWGDVFVTQIISASGVYTYGYSTYLGGSDCYDSGYGIAVDGDGNAYVTG
jgi:hypothetical protein